jgi:lactate dehydrogenase-like 2-hydroxyacid dehydrogenase
MIDVLALIRPFPPTDELLDATFNMHMLPKEQPERDEMLDRVGSKVRALVTGTNGFVDDALLARLPALEIIACFSAGMDPIDLDAVHRRNLKVFNNSEALLDTVADLAMGLLLALARDIPGADAHVREGKWLERRYRPGHLLRGRRMGIVGLGNIGRGIARRAEPFGIEIGYNGPNPKDVPYRYFADLMAMAEWADILMLSLPGGPETNGLVTAEILDALGPQGWLVNVARGSVVDEAALVRAIVEKRIGGAALDVFAKEPQVPQALIDSDRVILSPHQGSSSVEVLPIRAELTVGTLRRHFGM